VTVGEARNSTFGRSRLARKWGRAEYVLMNEVHDGVGDEDAAAEPSGNDPPP
jgi:hypothetical protein